MNKYLHTWLSIVFVLLLAGCASPGVNLPSPTNPTHPSVTPGETASVIAPTEEMHPGSGGGSPQVPLPVIILSPGVENPSPTLEADMAPATAEQSEQIRLATQDLARRLEVPSEEISLIDITAVVWSDGSLGCPQPDMFYTQALVEGTRIRLQVDDVIYHYHSGGNQEPFLCENPADVRGGPGYEITE
jgi:hypothetical protein